MPSAASSRASSSASTPARLPSSPKISFASLTLGPAVIFVFTIAAALYRALRLRKLNAVEAMHAVWGLSSAKIGSPRGHGELQLTAPPASGTTRGRVTSRSTAQVCSLGM